MNLENKVVLVTGATGGIGKCVVKMLKMQGAIVIGIYVSAEKDFVEDVQYYKIDVSDYAACSEVVQSICNKYQQIDVLINAAGMIQDALVGAMEEKDFDKVLSVNLKGTWNMCKLVGPGMQKKGKGSIVNVGSVVGKYGNIGQANYAASKSGMIGLSKSLAKEFTRNGAAVRVNVVSPGYTKTSMLEDVPEKLLKKFADMTMLKRLAEPEEIARVILFLADDASSYITGTVIDVDGGMRL